MAFGNNYVDPLTNAYLLPTFKKFQDNNVMLIN